MNETNSENIQRPEGSWWNNLISVVLIVFLIVTGVFAFNRNSTPSEDDADQEVANKIEEIQSNEQNSQDENANSEETVESSESSDNADESTTPTIVQDSEKIEVYAVAGDGVTHLARKAIHQYLKDKDMSLSKEQKLYAETVLKNMYKDSNPHLAVGDSISFSMSSITDTITNAENLSESQIQAWSQYTYLVPSL